MLTIPSTRLTREISVSYGNNSSGQKSFAVTAHGGGYLFILCIYKVAGKTIPRLKIYNGKV